MRMQRANAVSRRGIAVGAAAITAALALGGCAGSTSPATTELDVYNWGSADEAAVYDAAFDRFSAANEGVQVNNSVVPVTLWGDYVSKLATQIASGNSPDLLNMAMEGTQLSHSNGLLTPLDDFVAEGALDEQLSKIPQPLLDAYTIDGQLYEIPNGWQTMVIYANTDLFEEKGVPLPDPDWTWEDFRATAKALTGDDVMGFGLPWGFFQLQPWLFSNNASFVSEDGEPNLTDPAVVESVTFVRDLVQTDKVAPDPTSVDVYSQFAAGKFGMIGAGRWPIPGWSEAGFTSYVPLPWPKQESHTTVFGGSGWAISEDSENKELAWKAIQTLLEPETVTAITDIGQQIPVYAGEGTSTGDAAADDALAFLETQIDTARPVPAPPYYDTLEAVAMRYLQQIVSGQIEVEAGLQAAQDELEAAIK